MPHVTRIKAGGNSSQYKENKIIQVDGQEKLQLRPLLHSFYTVKKYLMETACT